MQGTTSNDLNKGGSVLPNFARIGVGNHQYG